MTLYAALSWSLCLGDVARTRFGYPGIPHIIFLADSGGIFYMEIMDNLDACLL